MKPDENDTTMLLKKYITKVQMKKDSRLTTSSVQSRFQLSQKLMASKPTRLGTSLDSVYRRDATNSIFSDAVVLG